MSGRSAYWYTYSTSISTYTTTRNVGGAIYCSGYCPGFPASPYGAAWHS